ncbi:DUF805 domain-containing protein [Porphyromonas circumdentaria]|uniref:Uncharacterized membrane protein YhaH, DUF805 family n=1 Tax=Porphyromonas circumdentaria TaxID=29524 RepID=A0A1T4PC86_9PORP|nr:DUF805 domain-containing protein [Porphyromonas circumdentaria]MBB6276365.1 uncharacterized membrane protein YhaH (DUF805 family) [Porphyromonas circumdentaria]MDO4722861.1 DUF805 domain-containing protein [Porphyromonas circumdentaria]SJZ88816.1 Uncharacterized membrane protein YhaH, DUF805 family [Porphyromonas circumdentaria]
MKLFYILVGHQQEGPLSLQEVLERNLPDETLVWCQDWAQWQPFASVKEALEMELASLQSGADPYFLSTLTERLGSFSLEELERQPHLLQQATLVWKKGMPSWVEVDKIEELRRIKERFSSERATPSTSQTDGESQREQGNEPPPIDPSFHSHRESSQGLFGEVPPSARGVKADSLWHYFTRGFTERFASFSGRARRSEFWGFVLFYYIFSRFFSFLGRGVWCTGRSIFCFPRFHTWNARIEGFFSDMMARLNGFLETFFSWMGFSALTFLDAILMLVSLLLLIPLLAVAVRRLHDAGYSGWYLLLGLIPLVGWIFLLILFCKDSVRGVNRYGVAPKYPNEA